MARKGKSESSMLGISKAKTVKTTFKKGIRSDSPSSAQSGGVRKAKTVNTKVPKSGYK